MLVRCVQVCAHLSARARTQACVCVLDLCGWYIFERLCTGLLWELSLFHICAGPKLAGSHAETTLLNAMNNRAKIESELRCVG